jgi:hypothetical protein
MRGSIPRVLRERGAGEPQRRRPPPDELPELRDDDDELDLR